MSLFSFLRKNKQESAADERAFHARAETEPSPARSRRRKQASQGDDPIDPLLPEKKRARRRLIGAIALVLAAIIGLPMILDSEPKPATDEIAIQIPSKDKTPPAAHRQADPLVPSRISTSAALDPKEEVIELPAASAVKPVSAAGLAAERPNDAGKASDPVGGAANDKPAAPPAVNTDGKPDRKTAEKVDEAARAKGLLEGKADSKDDEKKLGKPGKFVIQVAALATKEKVNELQTRLKDAGIKSYTQRVPTESGDRIRIRVGPFASKEEADRMRAKIVKLGLNGTLVPA